MKRYNYIYAMALAGGMLMTACSQNEETAIPTPNHTFRISVVDEGINAGNAAARATTDDSYKTTFEEGDQIGLFMVEGETTTKNICLEMGEDGNWTVPAGTTLSQTATYHAYYPYDENMTTLAEGEDPFATWINTKALVTDQSTAELYAANDLMTTDAEGVTATAVEGSNDYTITLAMKHRMALVVVSLPSKVYQFTNTETTLSNYVIPVSDATFMWGESTVKPLQVGNTYRFLVKPSEAMNLSGTFNSTKQYSVSGVSIAAGNYHLYEVDKNNSETVSFELSVGDYYCKDGSLIESTASLTDDDKANIIGVVASVGYDNETYPHGMVYALKRAERPNDITATTTEENTSKGYGPYTFDNTDEYLSTWANSSTDAVASTSSEIRTILAGNNGLAATECWLNNSSITESEKYYLSAIFDNYVASPLCSSSWFLPSYSELKKIHENSESVNASIENITSSEKFFDGCTKYDGSHNNQVVVDPVKTYFTSTIQSSTENKSKYQLLWAVNSDESLKADLGGRRYGVGYFRFALAF